MYATGEFPLKGQAPTLSSCMVLAKKQSEVEKLYKQLLRHVMACLNNALVVIMLTSEERSKLTVRTFSQFTCQY
jgi:hypothetical protein